MFPNCFTPSSFRCWLNITNDISSWTFLPLIVSFCLICIMTEAAAIGDTKRWPLTNHDKYTAAMYVTKKMNAQYPKVKFYFQGFSKRHCVHCCFQLSVVVIWSFCLVLAESCTFLLVDAFQCLPRSFYLYISYFQQRACSP